MTIRRNKFDLFFLVFLINGRYWDITKSLIELKIRDEKGDILGEVIILGCGKIKPIKENKHHFKNKRLNKQKKTTITG